MWSRGHVMIYNNRCSRNTNGISSSNKSLKPEVGQTQIKADSVGSSDDDENDFLDMSWPKGNNWIKHTYDSYIGVDAQMSHMIDESYDPV